MGTIRSAMPGIYQAPASGVSDVSSHTCPTGHVTPQSPGDCDPPLSAANASRPSQTWAGTSDAVCEDERTRSASTGRWTDTAWPLSRRPGADVLVTRDC